MEETIKTNNKDVAKLHKIHISEHEIFKINIFENNIPHIFVQNAIKENRFRFSTSYEKLNKDFNLKMEIVRDISSLSKNIIFTLFDNKEDKYLNKFYSIKEKFVDFNISSYYTNIERVKVSENNDINIEKIRFRSVAGDNENTTLILVTKKFQNSISQGLFFVSDKYFNIKSFIKNID